MIEINVLKRTCVKNCVASILYYRYVKKKMLNSLSFLAKVLKDTVEGLKSHL